MYPEPALLMSRRAACYVLCKTAILQVCSALAVQDAGTEAASCAVAPERWTWLLSCDKHSQIGQWPVQLQLDSRAPLPCIWSACRAPAKHS